MQGQPSECEIICRCLKPAHETNLLVITGGPGAGKTAVVEMAKKNFCRHVAVLPEAASLIFTGGFWRLGTDTARRAVQRAIYHVQREMEHLVTDEKRWGLAICDRGTLDGLAYWPGDPAEYWREVGSSEENELFRYRAVIHLRTPTLAMGYSNHANALRIESAEEAKAIDQRIHNIWSRHRNYAQIDSADDFFKKATMALKLISDNVPECCGRA